jgi:hypothetical protein
MVSKNYTTVKEGKPNEKEEIHQTRKKRVCGRIGFSIDRGEGVWPRSTYALILRLQTDEGLQRIWTRKL